MVAHDYGPRRVRSYASALLYSLPFLRKIRLPLRRVDLRRTNFYHATLIKVDLGDSNLAACATAGVRWERCRFYNTDLRKTHVEGATLNQSEFNGAHLQGANLAGASLREANLSDASLGGASLRNADLRGADLTRSPRR